MDYEKCAAEFIRALRGRRSQNAFARRLGYKSNVIYTWESGRGWPTAAVVMKAARRVRIDPNQAVARFYRTAPAWLSKLDMTAPAAVARLLTDLKGHTSIQQIVKISGHSRFAVSRWLKGKTEPRLPDFFCMIEATSLRLVDFIAAFVDPAKMSSIADAWRDLEATRAAAHDAPWTQAVLRALELSDYGKLPEHQTGWIARRIGIDTEEEVRCIELLSKSGQICLARGRWVINRVLAVDARKDAESTYRLREWWLTVALERLKLRCQGTFSYNVCAVSSADYQRIRSLYRDFFLEVQSVIAQSEPVEKVVVLNSQLFSLDE
jgi:transcriptional regulator with XRE-family HTH domain